MPATSLPSPRNLVTAPADRAGTTYRLSGPESISYPDAAVQLIAVRGRPIDYQTVSFDDQRSALIAAGGPEASARVNSQVLELFFRGDSDWVTDGVSHILGRPARTFRDLAVEYAPAFMP